MRKMPVATRHPTAAVEVSQGHRQGGLRDSAASRAEAFVAHSARVSLTQDELERLGAEGMGLAPLDWREVVGRALAGGVQCLVYVHASRAHLLPVMPEDVRDGLSAGYHRTLTNNLRLVREQQALVAALTNRGIECATVKGVALAARYYGDLALRPVRDIDLLIHRADATRCAHTLVELEYRPREEMGDPHGFHALWNRALQFQRGDGPTIELHWELASHPAYLGRLAIADVWRRMLPADDAGSGVRYLDARDELQYLCFHHAVQHRGERLIWLTDIAELVRSLPATWDWPDFVDETIAKGLALPVWMCLDQASAMLGVVVPPAAMAALGAASTSPRELRAWRSARGSVFRLRTVGAYLRSFRSRSEQILFAYGALRRTGAQLWSTLALRGRHIVGRRRTSGRPTR